MREARARESRFMPEPFNRLLVRPSGAELSAVLREAIAVSPVPPLTQLSPAGWDALLARTLTGPEGRVRWEGSDDRHVSLAWWTDHQGGRHARVQAGHGAVEGRHRRRDPGDRPPLWPVYPDRL